LSFGALAKANKELQSEPESDGSSSEPNGDSDSEESSASGNDSKTGVLSSRSRSDPNKKVKRHDKHA